MEEKQKNQRRHLLDFIVISAIVLVATISLLFVLLFRKSGDVAVVKVDGETIGEYPLSQNGTFTLNGGTNTLVIENGAAYLINSRCPNHDCERMGKIKYVGQLIECLPNHLSVTLKGDKNNGVDFVS